jgi:hypothetical protein
VSAQPVHQIFAITDFAQNLRAVLVISHATGHLIRRTTWKLMLLLYGKKKLERRGRHEKMIDGRKRRSGNALPRRNGGWRGIRGDDGFYNCMRLMREFDVFQH